MNKTSTIEKCIHSDSSPVRILRQELGLSTRKFAKLLKVAPSTIYRWEHKGDIPIPSLMDKVEALAKKHGIDIEVGKKNG